MRPLLSHRKNKKNHESQISIKKNISKDKIEKKITFKKEKKTRVSMG
jgi:hypothetical protein